MGPPGSGRISTICLAVLTQYRRVTAQSALSIHSGQLATLFASEED